VEKEEEDDWKEECEEIFGGSVADLQLRGGELATCPSFMFTTSLCSTVLLVTVHDGVEDRREDVIRGRSNCPLFLAILDAGASLGFLAPLGCCADFASSCCLLSTLLRLQFP
jgi:hypothetical protein